ncbi:hypothetical protein NQ315_001057 [Exocentrus adspersus]|uniref:Uncharacterized protein n=1 Tax=Exocentrus adspersus TaxID=1586481 RepID=A0AAV8WFG9_9CUCU|nr:hypothetical protein NQ315_001057 [Exocentrus adspersus]
MVFRIDRGPWQWKVKYYTPICFLLTRIRNNIQQNFAKILSVRGQQAFQEQSTAFRLLSTSAGIKDARSSVLPFFDYEYNTDLLKMFKLVVLLFIVLVTSALAKPSLLHGGLVTAPVISAPVVLPAAVSHSYRTDVISKPIVVPVLQKTVVAYAAPSIYYSGHPWKRDAFATVPFPQKKSLDGLIYLQINKGGNLRLHQSSLPCFDDGGGSGVRQGWGGVAGNQGLVDNVAPEGVAGSRKGQGSGYGSVQYRSSGCVGGVGRPDDVSPVGRAVRCWDCDGSWGGDDSRSGEGAGGDHSRSWSGVAGDHWAADDVRPVGRADGCRHHRRRNQSRSGKSHTARFGNGYGYESGQHHQFEHLARGLCCESWAWDVHLPKPVSIRFTFSAINEIIVTDP